ncbi:MAG TPA: hypothetical protein VMW04_01855 [Patescibacteria group bacterium]|nr:hypothetical protein [Patescibacteria group bacterium]
MRVILRLLLALFLVLVVILLVGGFFWWLSGGVPSRAAQPEDLGIEYSGLDRQVAESKTGVKTMQINSVEGYFKTVSYEGSHPVETVFTQEEISALANGGAWQYYPLKAVQIRLNSDSSLEASGWVLTETIGDYIEATGGVDSLVTRLIKLLGFNKQNLPFYLKGSIAIKDNELNLRLQKAKLGSVPLPLVLLEGNSRAINDFVKRQMLFVQGLSIDSLEIKNRQLELVGTLPDIERISVY